MNDAEIRDLKKGIILTASYYGKDIKPEVIAMMVDDLLDLDFESVSRAYKKYRLDPKNSTFPLPAKIRSLIIPQSNSREQAQEIAQRCFGAIRKFGYTKPEKAKEYIGELGWKLIGRRGGWHSHCTHTQESDIPILTAQFRESISVYVEQGEVNDEEFFNKVGLVSSKENVLMIEQVQKEIEEKESSEKITKVVFEIKKIPKRVNDQEFNIDAAKEAAIERFKKAFCDKKED